MVFAERRPSVLAVDVLDRSAVDAPLAPEGASAPADTRLALLQEQHRLLSRRRVLASGLGLGAAALLAACGGDDDDGDANEDEDNTGTGSASPPAVATTTAGAAATPSEATTAPTAAATAAATEATEDASPAATEAEDGADSTSPATGSGAGAPTGAGWTWTDSRGTTLEFDSVPTKIVAEVTVAASLWDLGIRATGIYGTARDVDGGPSAQAGNIDLDAVTSLGEEWGEFDVEAAIAMGAEVVIDQDWGNGFMFGLSEETEALVMAALPTLTINVVEGTIVNTIERYEEFAAALGADLDAPEVVAGSAAFDVAQADLQAVIDARPELTVAFISPTVEGIFVAHPDASSDLRYYRELGLDIVEHPNPQDFWEQLSWEQANRYPADIFLLDARAGYERPEEYADITTWEQLPAVIADQVGPWYFNLPYTRQATADVFTALTEILTTAEDVV